MQFLRSRSNKHERKFKRMNDKCFGNATRCKVSTAISNSTFQTFTTVLSTLIENIFNSQEKTMKIVSVFTIELSEDTSSVNQGSFSPGFLIVKLRPRPH